MKFGMAITGEERVIHVGIPEGVYAVNFDTKSVEFYAGISMEQISCLNIIMYSPEFTKADLKSKGGPYDPTGKAKHFDCGCLKDRGFYKEYQFNMEYLDTSEGPISNHNHEKGVREVYLSVKEPFVGEVCGEGEFHEPFEEETLAVKLIDNNR